MSLMHPNAALWRRLSDLTAASTASSATAPVAASGSATARTPRVVVTRESGKNGKLMAALAEHGVDCIELPLIEHAPGPDRYVCSWQAAVGITSPARQAQPNTAWHSSKLCPSGVLVTAILCHAGTSSRLRCLGVVLTGSPARHPKQQQCFWTAGALLVSLSCVLL